MTDRTAATALALAAIMLASGVHAQTCPPAAMSREQLVELKSHEFALPDAARRQALALDLLPCLGSTDPQLRDGIAFEALLSTWMRDKQLSAATVGTVLERLVAQLTPDQPDPAGVQRPFAVLTLAEVVRFDRIAPFMTDRQLQQLVEAGTRYLESIRDYRGFDERDGWRHAVAHASGAGAAVDRRVDQAAVVNAISRGAARRGCRSPATCRCASPRYRQSAA